MSDEKAIDDQRSHLTIMFTDLSRSTAIAATMEPEQYSILLDQMRSEVGKIIKLHGGDIVRIDGDGFLFTFGHPILFEDGARRAVEAALDIHACLTGFNIGTAPSDLPLNLHTGIHSGMVLLKSGDVERGRYEVLGTPTNVTSKLCTQARAGEIIISDEALGRSIIHFQHSTSPDCHIQGQTEALKVRKIVGRERNVRTIQTRLMKSKTISGRIDELAWINNFIIDDQRSTKIALIQAEAGLGKSRLLHEIIQRAAQIGNVVHHSICEHYLGTKTFQPIEQLTRSIMHEISNQSDISKPGVYDERINDLNNTLNLIENTKPFTGPADKRIQAISDSFAELCQHTAQDPIILIIDDWQWADTASRQIIERLAKLQSRAIRILLASRNFDEVFVEMHSVNVLKLKPLTADEIESAVRNLIPAIEPFSLMHIQKYSGGNPLYLEELCYAVRDSRFGFGDKKTGSWLNSLIYTRYSQLPKRLANIVKICAVIGHIIPDWLLAEMTDVSTSPDALDALKDADFLYPAETRGHYRFKHGITCDVIYDMIGLDERITLHKAVIEKLEQRAEGTGSTEAHDQLAYHHGKAGSAQASLRHSQIAGKIALSASILDKAQAHFRNAIEQAEKTGCPNANRIELIKQYGQACYVDPSIDQREVLSQAVERAHLSGDPEFIYWSEYWLGSNLYGLGVPKQSLIHFNNALDALNQIPNKQFETQLVANIGQVYGALGEYETAYARLDTSIRRKKRDMPHHGKSVSLAYMLSCKGFALGDQGHFDKADACFDEADSFMGSYDHQAYTSIINHRTGVALWRGDFEACLQLSSKAMELSRKVRSRHNYAMAYFMNSAVKFYESGDDIFITKMMNATDWLLHDSVYQNLSINFGFLSDALVQKERWADARRYAGGALMRARLGDKTCESLAFRSLAQISSAGHAKRTPEQYLALAYQSAKNRASVRELENTQYFENRFFGTGPDRQSAPAARFELA